MNEPATSPVWLTLSIVGGFVIFFPLMWCFVVWLLSQIGGWSRLAQRYAAGTRPVSGQTFKFVTGMVGATSYRNILTLHLNEDGFFIEPMALFRVAHPRLFIPWQDVTDRSIVNLLWWQAERLMIGIPKVGTITLPASILNPHNS